MSVCAEEERDPQQARLARVTKLGLMSKEEKCARLSKRTKGMPFHSSSSFLLCQHHSLFELNEIVFNNYI